MQLNAFPAGLALYLSQSLPSCDFFPARAPYQLHFEMMTYDFYCMDEPGSRIPARSWIIQESNGVDDPGIVITNPLDPMESLQHNLVVPIWLGIISVLGSFLSKN